MQILVVEDDAGVQAFFEKRLSLWQHKVLKADSVHRALEMVSGAHIDMLIVKRMLPDGNAIELCTRIRELRLNHTIFMLLALDQASDADIAQGLSGGADDYIVMPCQQGPLQVKLAIASRIVTLQRELNRTFLTLKRNYYQTMNAFLQLLEAFNAETAGHCRRVGQLALSMAKRHPKVLPEDYPIIEACGSLHDIGFIGLPQPVLNKRRTELTGDEIQLYRSHSQRGEAILNQMDLLKPIAKLVRKHHEQHNGRGFPDGLTHDQIPLAARIVAGASIYDDLIHREKIQLKQIPERLQNCRGYQLDPEVVEILLEIHIDRLQEEAGQDNRAVDISELAPDMVLARDVLMKSGAFLMAADTRLDAVIIQKLKRYSETGNISDKVFIKK